MTMISLDQAEAVIGGALARAAELRLKPLTVAILDAGGHLVALARQDGSSNLRPAIAIAKASGALDLGVSSRKIGEMAAERPTFVASLSAIAAAGVVPAAGGVIVEDGHGRVLGAIGVTGDLSDNDEICAVAGAEAAGLRTLP
ncbi:GlcG protein [Sphingomonas sp. Root710]|uniref:GlcG/HbpS family heme-binding protein n=1 Tax=Sphingomonas sp. Root710 TaxID=1736594 RepID=UPI0006F915D6|nr:heme-binding protein [Sphingomonas sp. Root710]KRB80640.1 GlcG protein [Sphingomonas sp. Root710]